MTAITNKKKEFSQMENRDIRLEARGSGVPLWKIAKKLNISEPTLTRHLRLDLPTEEKLKIRSIIEELKEVE
jgi:hypothetical protein